MSPFQIHFDEYQRLIEFLPDAIVLHKDGYFVYLNQTAFQLLGIDQRKEDWRNKTVFDIVHPAYHEAVKKRSEETFQEGVVNKIEYQLNQMTGESVFVECRSILFDYNNETCILSVLRDITDKIRMERQLKMSELWYKSLFKYYPDGVYSLDLDNHIVSTNPALEKYTGHKEEELIGKSFVPYVVPSDLERTFYHLEKAKQGEVQRYDIQVRTSNGDTFDINITNIPIIVDGEIVGIYGIAKDMTPTKQAERDLQESEEKYRMITENSFDIVVILDKEGLITYASPSHEYYLGYSVEEVIGKPGLGFIFEEDLPRAEEALYTLILKKIPVSIELRYKRKDSSPIWLEIKGTPFLDNKQEFQTAVMVARDITERKILKEELTYTAYHDALTGLANRWKLEEELHAAIQHNQKTNQKLALLYLDMDRFKIVNDTLGHDVGDLLLEQVAERLKQTVQKRHVIARMGGDEFAILLTEICHTDEAAEIAQRVLSTVRERFYIKGNELHMTISMGISVFPHDGQDIVNLLKCAETAMYQAKEEGKNNYKLCTSRDGKQKYDQLRFENHLRKAIQNRELFVQYQPRVGLQSNRIEGVEALIRWNHPHWGIISPAEFIPVAEETGLIIPIGAWVLETACRQNKNWQEKGFQPMRVSVNLSMRQFLSTSLTDTISSILKKTGLDPLWLELEITESMMMRDVSFTVEVLNEIKKMGIHISIDDFGTGYSSLSYLKKLPIDTLKIDRSFIQDIPEDEDNMAITTSIISMGKHLKKRVVAEGVEEESQVQFLLEQGCHEYQGFYCSPPTDPERIELFLNKYQ